MVTEREMEGSARIENRSIHAVHFTDRRKVFDLAERWEVDRVAALRRYRLYTRGRR